MNVMKKFIGIYTAGIKRILLIAGILFLSMAGSASAQQLKLGQNRTLFDSSAALEIESQKLVLLLSRIDDTATIVKTAKDGALVYYNDLPSAGAKKGFYIRSNGKWNWLSTAGQNDWLLQGNAGTNSAFNFLGTSDNHPLLFKTNNLVRLFIDSATGNAGFGTTQPGATLHNAGSSLFGVKAIGDLATGGAIGPALNTVDSFTIFSVAQATAGQTLSLPAPANATAGRIAILMNTGTVAFTVETAKVNGGTAISLLWSGTQWRVLGDGVGSGTFTVPYSYLPLTSLGMMEGAAERTTGANNIAIGQNALQVNTTGYENIAIGANALRKNDLSASNIAVGSGALGGGTSGSGNIGIGWTALYNNLADYNTAVGSAALALNTTGKANTALGHETLFSNTTGNNNTGLGKTALRSLVTDSNNTALGFEAAYFLKGSGNTAFGSGALRAPLSSSNCTALGFMAGNKDGTITSASNISNATAIGAYAQITNDNTIILGSANGHLTNVGIGLYNPSYKMHVNGSVAGLFAYGSTSDRRLKTNLQPVLNAFDKIKALQAVTFNWNQEAAAKAGLNLDSLNHYGFIAQQVEKILPQVVNTATNSMHIKSIAYTDIIPVLAEAIRQEQPGIENLHQQHHATQRQLALLKQRLNELEKKINAR
jgi:hypothetical protein